MNQEEISDLTKEELINCYNSVCKEAKEWADNCVNLKSDERLRIYKKVKDIPQFAELDDKRWDELINQIVKIIYEIK